MNSKLSKWLESLLAKYKMLPAQYSIFGFSIEPICNFDFLPSLSRKTSNLHQLQPNVPKALFTKGKNVSPRESIWKKQINLKSPRFHGSVAWTVPPSRTWPFDWEQPWASWRGIWVAVARTNPSHRREAHWHPVRQNLPCARSSCASFCTDISKTTERSNQLQRSYTLDRTVDRALLFTLRRKKASIEIGALLQVFRSLYWYTFAL